MSHPSAEGTETTHTIRTCLVSEVSHWRFPAVQSAALSTVTAPFEYLALPPVDDLSGLGD